MSYGRFLRPKFYNDFIKYLLAVDWIAPTDIVAHKQELTNFAFQTSTDAPTFTKGTILDLFDGHPQNYIEVPANTKQWGIRINTRMVTNSLGETNYLALLNHNFNDAGVEVRAYVNDSTTNSAGTSFSVNEIVEADAVVYGSGVFDNTAPEFLNYDGSGAGLENGWTLIEYPTSTSDNQYLFLFFTPANGYNQNFDAPMKLGSVLWGESLQFPHSVDMKMSQTIDYSEGLSRNKSVGGNDYFTKSHLGAPTWVSGLPWQNTAIGDAETYFFQQRWGRRKFNFKMSYLDEQTVYSRDSTSSDYAFWFDSESFHQMIYNRTLGGTLPFIVNADSDNASPPDDAFGYYRFKKNSMDVKKVAHRTYNLDFDIEETW